MNAIVKTLFLSIVAISLTFQGKAQNSTSSKEVTMYKSPTCNCCAKWANHMEEHGFKVTTVKTDTLLELKSDFGIPTEDRSCHTAVVDGYIVEGHVPASDVQRLLRNQPNVLGVVVPGMPPSSPGMNTEPGVPFKSFLLSKDGTTEEYQQH